MDLGEVLPAGRRAAFTAQAVAVRQGVDSLPGWQQDTLGPLAVAAADHTEAAAADRPVATSPCDTQQVPLAGHPVALRAALLSVHLAALPVAVAVAMLVQSSDSLPTCRRSELPSQQAAAADLRVVVAVAHPAVAVEATSWLDQWHTLGDPPVGLQAEAAAERFVLKFTTRHLCR